MALVACDNSSSTPPPAPAPGNTPGGNPISRLSDNPSSLLGKSAARGRDVAKDVANDQAATVGVAGEITGETTAIETGGLQWHAPVAWQSQKPANNMRAAQLLVAPDSGAGEAMIVFSSGIGGDIKSNIERWKGQVTDGAGQQAEAEVRARKVAGFNVTTVAMDGTLVGGTMGGPAVDRPNSSFRAAIIEGPSGNIFIKFTGPASVVSENSAAWEQMINGMRKP